MKSVYMVIRQYVDLDKKTVTEVMYVSDSEVNARGELDRLMADRFKGMTAQLVEVPLDTDLSTHSYQLRAEF